ncbi:TIGR01621 family pseudouridine synthase [Corallincola luteus]|uniref:TIGR01621 family pseudouridine synthase n=1 Tax=Corallincola luteus TaxID=1775177 RepID=A0ABY2AIX6_9GAMM|nr:TIGR01621 family pseudouridine synthase [Corallincola luteus]TCI02661.1 TIGR01621 family pseudouridine synthase [Corallincola luteus]
MNKALAANAVSPIFVHDDFWIFNKPAGISCHDEPTTGEHGYFRLLRQALLEDVYPVHRLDKVTSGLLIVARSSEAAAQFGSLFANREMQKFYLAISDRKPKKKQGWVIGDMQRSRRSSWRLTSGKSDPAVSQFFSYSMRPGLRLFVVKPLSGKTHQIRVALKSLSAPIVGDHLYAGTPADRTYLHAYAVEFNWLGECLRYHCLPTEGVEFSPVESLLMAKELSCPWLLPWPQR